MPCPRLPTYAKKPSPSTLRQLRIIIEEFRQLPLREHAREDLVRRAAAALRHRVHGLDPRDRPVVVVMAHDVVHELREALEERLLHAPVADVLVVPLEDGADAVGVGLPVVDVRVLERERPVELVVPPEGV